MKRLFIPTKYKENVKLPASFISKLPKKVVLFTTIQFYNNFNSVKKQLENKGKTVIVVKTRHTKYPGQIYGCNTERISKDFDAFVYIGDGMFHPKALLLNNEKDVFVFNPISRKNSKMTKKDIDKIEKRRKAGKLKFLSSKDIGILVSMKPGQFRYNDALKLEKKYKNKRFYYLLFDNIDLNELENFNFIGCFVNTACPRIGFDDMIERNKIIINLEDI